MKVINRMELANAVLHELKKLMKADKGTLYVYSYRNGRENGFVVDFSELLANHSAVTFSENRNSDQVVVYWGDWDRVENRDLYYKGRTFYPTPEQAALDIANFFRTGNRPK